MRTEEADKFLSASLFGKERRMRKTVAYLAVSLDGFIADTDGGVGWLDDFADAQEDGGYEAFVQNVDTVVMGGRTYRQVTQELSPEEWPYAGLDCRVWTHGTEPLPHARRIEGDFAVWLHAQKEKPGKDIWLCGGAALIAAAAAAGEVDRWQLTVLPVLLGEGIRLFPAEYKQRLRLVSARQSGSIAELIYEPEMR